MRLKQNEEGISEPIGYLLILGVIISALGVIIVFSSPIVEQGKDTANFNNMLAGFSVLKTDLDTVALTSSPIRTTKLNPASGNIYVDPSGNVTKNRMIINGTTEIYNSTMGVIAYTHKDKKVIYECGGVIESYSTTNSTLFRENPKINVDRTLGGNNTLISIMKITGNFSSISGEGVAQVIITSPRYNETYNSGTSEVTLTITVNSVYASAWKKYLSDQGFEILSNSEGQVSAKITNTRVIIGEHRIDVRLR